jgi:hypothetical protein
MMLRRLVPVLALGTLVVCGGCPSTDSDVVNLLSAGAKLVADPSDPAIGDLTAAEILAISHSLPQLVAQFPTLGISPELAASVPQLTTEQADDLVGFLDTYNITTVSQLQDLIVQVSNGETEVDIPESLLQLVASLGYETDAANLPIPR